VVESRTILARLILARLLHASIGLASRFPTTYRQGDLLKVVLRGGS
jgi:hypothetical protein